MDPSVLVLELMFVHQLVVLSILCSLSFDLIFGHGLVEHLVEGFTHLGRAGVIDFTNLTFHILSCNFGSWFLTNCCRFFGVELWYRWFLSIGLFSKDV